MKKLSSGDRSASLHCRTEMTLYIIVYRLSQNREFEYSDEFSDPELSEQRTKHEEE